jgi:hypothetical protein
MPNTTGFAFHIYFHINATLYIDGLLILNNIHDSEFYNQIGINLNYKMHAQ